jgi:hypothetical protein
MSEKNNESLTKGLKSLAITLPLLFAAPLLITMGFKGVKSDDKITLGFALLIVGVILAITAIFLMIKGIKHLLDHLFEK